MTTGHPERPGEAARRSARAGRLAAAAAAAVAVCTVAVVFLLATMYPALRFTSTAPVRPTTAAPVAAPVASFTPAPGAPAGRVIAQLLAANPAGLPGGMRDASSVTGTVAPAVALTCDEPVGPVLSRQRSWAATSGGLGTGITVTASAYSAGAGAAAMKAMRTARPECSKGITVESLDGVGVEALRAYRSVGGVGVASIVLRRGDVLVSVTGARLDPPRALVDDLDHRLDQLLRAPGVCADQQADVAAFARSLVIGQKGFRGLQVATPVPLPSASTPLPDLAVPSATVALPAPVLATTPAEPYWPPSAPEAVASPSVPVVPSPYPTQTTVLQPKDDTVGPGCGWAFTGMTAPVFDDDAAARTTSERANAAVAGMQALVWAYPDKARAYADQWAAYTKAATEYAQTNQKIAEVEQAWAVIRQQQADYAAALQQYQAALADYTSFAERQQAAVTAYQQALVACATVTPEAPTNAPTTATTPATPTPGAPSTTAPTTPAPAGPTTAAPTTSSTPAPRPGTSGATPQAPGGAAAGADAAPAPLAAAPQVCPPVPDPIISAAPPASPVSPVPPPDPRPTPMPTTGADQ